MELFIISPILAIPTFFLIRLVLNRINPLWGRMNNPFLWLATICITPLVYLGLFLSFIGVSTYYPQRDFQKEAWLENEEKRYEYADDLVNHQKLIDLDKAAIKELLGKPRYDSDQSMTYYLGFSPRHFFGIDPDWMEIYFEEGKAKKVRIITG